MEQMGGRQQVSAGGTKLGDARGCGVEAAREWEGGKMKQGLPEGAGG